MSIFDELIILIDDQTEVGTERISRLLPGYTRQAIGSTLGRLVSRGSLEKVVRSGQEQYRLSTLGNDYIERTLEAIHRIEETWSGEWFCVVASLPESQRRERDMLRHHLTNRGFGRLVDGLWISPWNRQEEAAQIVRKLGIGSAVVVFETKPFGQATTQIVIQSAWNWNIVRYRVQQFVDHAAERLIELKKLHDEAKTAEESLSARLQAKFFVFSYGELLVADPNLPLNLTLERELYQQAFDFYQQVRPYCYQ